VTKSKSLKKKNKNLALKDSEDLFDKDAVSEFAFVDDENKKNNDVAVSTDKKDINLAENDEDELSLDREEEDGTEEVAFRTVHFDLNGDAIRSDQKDIVTEDCEKAKEIVSSGKKVVVAGNCCQLGAQSYNMALGLRRAESMKDELVKSGVSAEDIKTVSYGSEMPLVWSDKKDRTSLIKELAPNRRAEISVQ
jgi:outer membrane protein OmpA-like peptidoglycan-associated protein